MATYCLLNNTYLPLESITQLIHTCLGMVKTIPNQLYRDA